MTRRRLLPAAAILGGWTVIALLFAPQNYFANREATPPLPAWVVLVASASIFYVWAALTPFVIWLARRFPFQRGRFGRTAALHAVASGVVAVVHLVGVSIWQSLLPVPRDYAPPIPPQVMLVSLLATNVMLYWSILAVSTAITYFRRDQQRELSLMQAQLESLRSRLQPHFLFNTLNAIAELVHEDPKRAETTITQLSDVLRLTLQLEQQHEITLAEELELLRKHVAIYEVLLQDRLRVRWSIEQDALNVCVPTMILQPLVENAIRHGIAPCESGGTVCVSASRNGAYLLLRVEDDGVGLKPNAQDGIGLANTRARLRHLYGEEFALDMRSTKGVAVDVKVPL